MTAPHYRPSYATRDGTTWPISSQRFACLREAERFQRGWAAVRHTQALGLALFITDEDDPARGDVTEGACACARCVEPGPAYEYGDDGIPEGEDL